MDKTYPHGELRLYGADNRVEWRAQLDQSAELTAPTWPRTAGPHRLEIAWQRADGGSGRDSAAIPISGRELEFRGFITFFELYEHPQLHLELIEPAPPTVRWTISQRIDSEGLATVDVMNATDHALYDPNVAIWDWSDGRWQHARTFGFCPDMRSPLLPDAGTRIEFAASLCPTEQLDAGRHRRTVTFDVDEPGKAWETYRDTFDIHRQIQLEESFETHEPSVGPRSVLFAGLPISEMNFGGVMTFSNQAHTQFAATLLSPDGRQACACNGSRVGRENSEVTMGSLGLCAITEERDGGVTVCEIIHGSRQDAPADEW